MSNFITKDPYFKTTYREISGLEKKIRRAREKSVDRATKLLAGKLKKAISTQKWRIASKEEYSSYLYNKSDVYYDICLFRIPAEKAVSPKRSKSNNCLTYSPKLSQINANSGAAMSIPSKYPASYIPTPAKSLKTIPRLPKDVESYEDLMYFAERYDTSDMKFGKCKVIISYDQIRIVSFTGMDDIFDTIRELEIPLDLSHHIKDLEKMEHELKLKRSIIKDLSSKIFFS